MTIDATMNCDVQDCKNVQANEHSFNYEVTGRDVTQNICDLHYAYIILYGWWYGEGRHPSTWKLKTDRINNV